jgi:hypothetical protein
MRNLLERKVMIAELSLRVKRAVENAASGPLTKTRTASCGTYAKTNIKLTIPTESVIVGASLERRGFHNVRWLRK